MKEKYNSDNMVIGYYGDEMTIVEREDGELFYAPVSKGLYPLGTVVNDDELFSLSKLPIVVAQKIKQQFSKEG